MHVLNQIMTCDKTSMDPSLLGMLAILHISHDWMLGQSNAFQCLMAHLDLEFVEDSTVRTVCWKISTYGVGLWDRPYS